MLGEYLALQGGPSLLINTPKHFVLRINQISNSNFLEKITYKKAHPAFLLLEEYKKQLSSDDLDKFKNFLQICSFEDPYKGGGGFGCSGAEFLAVYIIINLHKIFFEKKEITKTQFQQRWDLFLNTEKKELNGFYKFKKLTNLGSGFDILSQLFGSLIFLESLDKNLDLHSLEKNNIKYSSNFLYKEFSWPFVGYKFSLLKSKNKVDTYKHLSELPMSKLELIKKKLKPIVKKGYASLEVPHIDNFLSVVKAQQKVLEEENFVCLESIDIVQELNKVVEISASKSCGALGADIFLIFYPTASKKLIKEKIKTSKILSSLLWMEDNYLSSGLKLQIKDR